MSGTLLDLKAEIVLGVDMARWGAIIDEEKLDTALGSISIEKGVNTIAPPPALIFEALRYGGPEDFRVVIIGQDPYPAQGQAQGLCFSVPSGIALPESLKRIYGCLDRAGLRREHSTNGEGFGPSIISGDLRPWAVQGVLMLNSALTTVVGERRAHADQWKPFVHDFLRRFCEYKSGACHFLLWGGDARAFAPVARKNGHVVLEWSHPSPLADNKLPEASRFAMCPHFELVNAALVEASLRPITWDNLPPSSPSATAAVGRTGSRAPARRSPRSSRAHSSAPA